MDKETKNMTRMAIYVAAGGYLIYLAYKLFSGLSQSEGFSHILGIVAMIVFGLGGVGMAAFGIWQLISFAKNSASEFENKDQNEETEQKDR